MEKKIRIIGLVIINFFVAFFYFQCGSVFLESTGTGGLGLLINFVVILPILFALGIARFFLRTPPHWKYWWLDVTHFMLLLFLAFFTLSDSHSTGIVFAMIGALIGVFDTIYSIISTRRCGS
jgi:hypothetical protein